MSLPIDRDFDCMRRCKRMARGKPETACTGVCAVHRDRTSSRTIHVSQSTAELLRAHVRPFAILTGLRPQPNGMVALEVDLEVHAMLVAISSDMDAAVRTVCTPGGVGRA